MLSFGGDSSFSPPNRDVWTNVGWLKVRFPVRLRAALNLAPCSLIIKSDPSKDSAFVVNLFGCYHDEHSAARL